MDKTSDKIDNRRRDFLRAAAAGAPVAAAAVALGGGVANAKPVVKAEKDAGFQETAHVRTYYDTARF